MNKINFNSFIIGLVTGIFFPLIGFFLYGIGWANFFNKTLSYFINQTFLGVSSNQSSIISLSILANLIPFYFYLNTKREVSAKGVLGAVFIYVPIIIYLRFY